MEQLYRYLGPLHHPGSAFDKLIFSDIENSIEHPNSFEKVD
jgi:hypothetical protein